MERPLPEAAELPIAVDEAPTGIGMRRLPEHEPNEGALTCIGYPIRFATRERSPNLCASRRRRFGTAMGICAPIAEFRNSENAA
jgi:hypothetical protein